MQEQISDAFGHRSLADRLDHPAEPWLAKAGDKLVGRILELDERTTDYGCYPVVTVETEEGSTEKGKAIPAGAERVFHAFRTVPKRELARLRPRRGERIGIAYFGKAEGKDYEGYRLVLDRDPESPDWDRIEAEAEAEPEADQGRDGTDGDIPF